MVPNPNRLGISHLLLWTTTTALVLAVGQWDLSTANIPENLLAEIRLHNFVWSLGFGPLHGLSLAGVLIFLWRRLWSRVPFPTEPGHWLLVVAGASELVHLAAQVVYLLAIRGHESSVPDWANLFSEFSLLGFPILLAAIGAFSGRKGRLWSLGILSMGLLAAVTAIHSVALRWLPAIYEMLDDQSWVIVFRLAYTLPGLLALLAAFIDWRQKQRHDFFHWCGVALVVLGPIVEWARSFLA